MTHRCCTNEKQTIELVDNKTNYQQINYPKCNFTIARIQFWVFYRSNGVKCFVDNERLNNECDDLSNIAGQQNVF